MNKIWKSKNDRGNAQKLIDALLSYTDKGIEQNIYTLLVRKELNALLGTTSDYNHSLSTLIKMKAEDKCSVEDFENMYLSIKDSTENNIKAQKCWMLFIPFDVATKIKEVQVLGQKFSIVDKSEVLPDSNTVEQVKRNLSSHVAPFSQRDKFMDELSPYFLKTEISASDSNQLWQKVEFYYDLIRGIVDFSMQYRGLFWRMNIYFRKRTYLRLPTLAIAIDESGDLEVINLIQDSKGKFKPVKFNLQQEKNFTFIATLLSEKNDNKNSIKRLIADCFRLYGQAMDTIHDYQTFLSFWQLAERIACSETSGGKTEVVVKRLNSFNDKLLPGSRCKHSLNLLAKKRNNIVHRGIHHIEEDDLNVIKLNCESSLHWLIHRYDQIKTEDHLKAYYQLRDLSSSDLEREARTTDIIKEVAYFIESERKELSK